MSDKIYNDPDVTAGMTDAEMDRLFSAAVELANKEKTLKGVPLPKFDIASRRAYLEYPDGRKEFINA